VARPVIALLTDFGTRDHYAGTMKGVVLGICPDATIVDITHEIAAHDVLGGALELAASYKYFPPGTIFLVVVDPGVGSARRGVAVQSGGYAFVCPDNGVLTAVLSEHAQDRAVELTERRYARPTVSRTFEGRDRFAPAAAWLAKGIELPALGRPAGALQRLDIPQPEVTADEIRGEVLRVDRFGNLITNIGRSAFERVVTTQTVDIRIGDHIVPRFVTTYADVIRGAVCALFGSSDHLEIAANGASAADVLSVERGAPVHILRRA
jgi:S-adenosyl-L-methionine hydrolase (adenosine-forming)